MRIDGLADDEAATVERLLGTINDKRERNWLRSQYYDAKRRPKDAGLVLPPHLVNTLGAVLGWPAKAVDGRANRARFQGLSYVKDEGVQRELDTFMEDNYLIPEIQQGIIASLEHSLSFLVADRGEADGEPESLLLVKDALNATGEWNVRRRGLDNFLSVTDWWGNSETSNARELAFHQPGKKVSYLRQETDGGHWYKISESKGAPLDHVTVHPMVYRPRKGREYGSSCISRPIMGITDMAVRTVVRAEVGAEFYSTPQRWLMGADEKAFGDKNPWQIIVGRIMALSDDEDLTNPRAEVGQFPQISMQPHMDQLRSLAQLFSGEASIPVSSLGISIDSNPTSADSYAASREDIISDVETALEASWRQAVERAVKDAMELRGVTMDDRVIARFLDPRYTSKAAASDAFSKQVAAMPWLAETEVAVDMLGYDPAITAQLKAERQKASSAQTLNNIANMAAAAMKPATTGAPTQNGNQ